MDRTDFRKIEIPDISDYCVVLERLAMAAGQTRWHVAEDEAELATILADVIAGSAVSLYFDGRLRRSFWSAETSSDVLAVVAGSGECVVAVGSPMGRELSPFFISGANDLTEFLGDLTPGSLVFFGPYPVRDNDGIHAVSFVVPNDLGRIDFPH